MTLGTKRECPACKNKFYDLGKTPAICPKCQFSYDPNAVKPAATLKKQPAPKKKPSILDDEDDLDLSEFNDDTDGGVPELEELDDMDDDLDSLGEVDDRDDDRVNSDDVDDDLLLNEMGNVNPLVDSPDEEEDDER